MKSRHWYTLLALTMALVMALGLAHLFGLIAGPGWESFTPPASVYLFQDIMRLKRLDLDSRTQSTLYSVSLTPHVGRWIAHYHGNIFGYVHAYIEPRSEGVEFRLSFSIPRQPFSDPWQLSGSSSGDYLKYRDDDVGLRLKTWLRDGNREFIVKTETGLFQLRID